MKALLRPAGVAMFAAASLLGTTAPAMASGDDVIVDGVKRSAAQVANWKGNLYVVAGRSGKPTIGFTDKAAFKAHVRTVDPASKRVAKASAPGDYVDLYSGHRFTGWSFRINSGETMNDLSSVCGGWFCQNYNDAVSSVATNQVGIYLYSETYKNRLNPTVGRWLYVPKNAGYEIPTWFDNAASSAYANWDRT